MFIDKLNFIDLEQSKNNKFHTIILFQRQDEDKLCNYFSNKYNFLIDKQCCDFLKNENNNNCMFSINDTIYFIYKLNNLNDLSSTRCMPAIFNFIKTIVNKNLNLYILNNNINNYLEFLLSFNIYAYTYKLSLEQNEKSNIIFNFIDCDKDEFEAKNQYFYLLKKYYTNMADLCNLPANYLNPQTFLSYISYLEDLPNVSIKSLNKNALNDLGMHSLLAVGQGSAYDSNVIQITLNEHLNEDPIVLIGKGVTYDTGGLSIKCARYMFGMHKDMAGAAFCASAIGLLAENYFQRKVIALLGIVENSVSHNSYRPNDVISSYSGKTIEIVNTDAEGRLVLADLLSFSCDKLHPEFIFDFATLTGAISIALGTHCPGVFTNNLGAFDNLNKYAQNNFERVWHMPLFDYFNDSIKSKVADVKNASFSNDGSSIFAAKFLEKFVYNDYKNKWMHLDIAGSIDTEQKEHSNRTLLLKSFCEFIMNEYKKN